MNFFTLFLSFPLKKKRKEKRRKYKNEKNLFYSKFCSRIDLDDQPHPRTAERRIAKGRGRLCPLSSQRKRKKMVRTKGIEENGPFCSLQGIARWKSNNNIFNSTNEFCFSYLFRIPRRLKCSLGCLLHYLLFHPCYFFFSIHLFGHQRVGEGETEETMQFHL